MLPYRRMKAEELYENVQRPRRQWQVVERTAGFVKLVRCDNPNIIRYPSEDALNDERRYRRSQTTRPRADQRPSG